MGFNIGGYLFNSSMASNQVSNKIVNKNLVFYVDGGDTNSYPGSGTTWYDISGNGNNATLYNSPSFSSSDGGGSFNFNGSNQYVQANVNSTILDGDPNFTIEFFVKRTATLVGTTAAYWGLGQGGTQGYAVQGWTPTDNRIHMDLWDSSRVDSQVDYPLNTYVHVVWSKTGTGISPSTVSCYVNGVLANSISGRGQTSGPNYPTSTSGNGISIGRIAGNYDGYYGACKIGLFRVYSRGLTGGEVLQNYYAQKSRFGL
jgi:hypothetical protein